MPDDLRAAAQHLATTDKGRDALRRLVDWFESSGLSLDAPNEKAVRALLDGAWGAKPGTVLDLMHEALGD